MSGSSGSTTNGTTDGSFARGGTDERILTTAASLFAQFGYNGVSTREIAAEADVNEVTIYRHFPRKRDLYLAVLSTELQQVHLQGDLLTRLAGAESGKQALVCTFELIATALRKPQIVRLLGFSVLEISEDLDPLLRQHLGELLELVARYLEPWIERGEIRCRDAKTLVLTLAAIVLSRGPLKRVFTGEAADMTALFEAYAEFCLA